MPKSRKRQGTGFGSRVVLFDKNSGALYNVARNRKKCRN